ncbi:MAG TPA: nuclear transport factor 2 family protein [Thermoanaerobaculia bacterium]|jgi:uncharacterized protein (TIGR02246 family)|nr:nuclear transport factor 2 family protein [Thermoanaerobaculia bacterium]
MVDPQEAAEVAAVNRLLADWAEAVQGGDLEVITTLVTDDAEFWSNGAAPLMGREALRAAFAGLFSRFRLEQRFDCFDLVVRGDLAFVRGMEHNTLDPLDGSPPVVRQQRAFSVMRRDPDGTWRFWRGMTNLPPQE